MTKSGSELPSIALLVPCYNASHHIGSFLNSLDQLDSRFDEVLFLDDGSTDDTADLLKRAGQTVIKQDRNRGAGAARNALLRASDCDYIHFHDIDDPFSRSDFISLLVPHLAANRVVFGATEFIELDGTSSVRPTQPDLLRSAGDRFVLSEVVHLNATIWPRQLLERVDGFRANLQTHEDIMLFIDAYAAGASFLYIEETLAQHRKNQDSTLHQKQDWEHDLQAIEVCLTAADVLPLKSNHHVAAKAIYHLRRLAIEGKLTEALIVNRRLNHIMSVHTWSYGSATERLLARWLGRRAVLRYISWRATSSKYWL